MLQELMNMIFRDKGALLLEETNYKCLIVFIPGLRRHAPRRQKTKTSFTSWKRLNSCSKRKKESAWSNCTSCICIQSRKNGMQGFTHRILTPKNWLNRRQCIRFKKLLLLQSQLWEDCQNLLLQRQGLQTEAPKEVRRIRKQLNQF